MACISLHYVPEQVDYMHVYDADEKTIRVFVDGGSEDNCFVYRMLHASSSSSDSD